MDKTVDNGYSKYLFIELLKLNSKYFSELTYDDQFDLSDYWRDLFLNSEFNTDDKSEYDCIQEFLAFNVNEIENYFYNEL